MNFKDASLDIESLENKFNKNREDLCRDAIENVKIRFVAWGVEIERRTRWRRIISQRELAQHSVYHQKKTLCMSWNLFFKQEATTRFTRLNDLNSKLGFMPDTQTLHLQRDIKERLKMTSDEVGLLARKNDFFQTGCDEWYILTRTYTQSRRLTLFYSLFYTFASDLILKVNNYNLTDNDFVYFG
jgi:hypothetical protein